MERVGDRKGKMETYCSSGQSPQRAVAPMEEEEDEPFQNILYKFKTKYNKLKMEDSYRGLIKCLLLGEVECCHAL